MLPLFNDKNRDVRLLALTASTSLLDPKLLGQLLELLKEPDSTIRTKAKSAIEAIRFHADTKRELRSWLKTGGRSAAEQLIEQSGPKQSKKIRLAAIKSLGTLGEAKSLPTLIELMKSDDADIAKAAAESVDRINSARK